MFLENLFNYIFNLLISYIDFKNMDKTYQWR